MLGVEAYRTPGGLNTAGDTTIQPMENIVCSHPYVLRFCRESLTFADFGARIGLQAACGLAVVRPCSMETDATAMPAKNRNGQDNRNSNMGWIDWLAHGHALRLVIDS